MTTTVQKWGNSLGLRIPKNIADSIGLSVGGNVSVSLKNGAIIVELKSKILDLKKAMKNYKPEDYHAELDWGSPVGKELW
jgi:antitoxin MazE